ncbi:MAG: hypothetical protein NW703_00415 [Nitrospiraceae bacterium]
MVCLHCEPLHDTVEADEPDKGSREADLRGRQELLDKAFVVGAVEVRGIDSGWIRIQVISDVFVPSLNGFIARHLMPDIIVVTDGRSGCAPFRCMQWNQSDRHDPHFS